MIIPKALLLCKGFAAYVPETFLRVFLFHWYYSWREDVACHVLQHPCLIFLTLNNRLIRTIRIKRLPDVASPKSMAWQYTSYTRKHPGGLWDRPKCYNTSDMLDNTHTLLTTTLA
eukprot:2327726-Amphidinium_carterae.1